jgi:hypothetical protein
MNRGRAQPNARWLLGRPVKPGEGPHCAPLHAGYGPLDGRAVFNVAGNKYRLVVWINYPYRVCTSVSLGRTGNMTRSMHRPYEVRTWR